MKQTIYGIYDENETLVCTGDKFECASFLGINVQSFFSRLSRQKKRKRCKYRVERLFKE